MLKRLWKAICEAVEAYGEAMRMVEMERYQRIIDVYNKKIEKSNKK